MTAATGTPSAQFETITPARAMEMLDTMDGNRPLRQGWIENLTEMMREGTFDPNNGEAIKFNVQGELIDGQHRLWAIVESGITQTMLVIRDVTPRAIYTVDVGPRRTFMDVLTINRYENRTHLATTVMGAHSYVYGYMDNPTSYRRPSHEQALHFLRSYEDSLLAAARKSTSMTTRGTEHGKVLTPSVYGTMYWLLSKYDVEEADAFFDRITLGDGLVKDDPVFTLRRTMAGLRNRKNNSMDVTYLRAITIKTWNAWIQGHPLKLLRWQPGGSKAEPFPEIFGRDEIWRQIRSEYAGGGNLPTSP